MKKTFQIILKKGRRINFDAVEKFTSDTNIKVIDFFKNETQCLFLNIEHNQLNTILDLTNVTPYTILYFNENYILEAAAFNTNENLNTPFFISTQHKLILLLPYLADFSAMNIDINIKLSYDQMQKKIL